MKGGMSDAVHLIVGLFIGLVVGSLFGVVTYIVLTKTYDVFESIASTEETNVQLNNIYEKTREYWSWADNADSGSH